MACLVLGERFKYDLWFVDEVDPVSRVLPDVARLRRDSVWTISTGWVIFLSGTFQVRQWHRKRRPLSITWFYEGVHKAPRQHSSIRIFALHIHNSMRQGAQRNRLPWNSTTIGKPIVTNGSAGVH